MIEVDEESFLIVTDIDRLIHLISTSDRIDLGRLSRELKMSKKEVEKWLHILEDEGLIKIEHSLTKVYAVWLGGEEPEKSVKVKPREAAPPKPQAKAQAPAPKKGEGKPPVSIFYEPPKEEEIAAPTAEEVTEEAHEAPEEPVEKKKEKALRPLLGEPLFAEEEEVEEEKPFSEVLKKAEERLHKEKGLKPLVKEKEERPLVEEAEEEPLEEERPLVREEEKPEPKKAKPEKPRRPMRELKLPPAGETASLKERLDDYLKLIQEGNSELKGLEAEKEKLYSEGYKSLEKEFEASLENIEYAILGKERKILEAKEKVSELPKKIEALEKVEKGLKGLDKNARSVLEKTKEQFEERWQSLEGLSTELNEQLEEGEREALRERTKMFELRELLQSISTNEESVRETLEESKRKMEETEHRITSMEDSLSEFVDARTLLNERISAIESSLDRRMSTLEELRESLEEIKGVEGWFKEYTEDYDRKVGELEEYVEDAREEIARLTEAAELEYVKKYLEELSRSEEGYKDKLRELELTGLSVDERISEVRSRIRELLKESSQLMERSRKAEGVSFREEAAAAKHKGKGKLAVLEEKVKEGKNLSEEVKRVSSKKRKKKKK